jgi:hypothetical protein
MFLLILNNKKLKSEMHAPLTPTCLLKYFSAPIKKQKKTSDFEK